jgi:outer membrane protein OmpA-like peptidoglycan-associated protein
MIGWRLSAVLLAVASFANAATAQVFVGSRPKPEVEVDLGALDQLGNPPTLPDLFLGRRPPAKLGPLIPPSQAKRETAVHLHPPHKVTLHKPIHHAKTTVPAVSASPAAAPAGGPAPVPVNEQQPPATDKPATDAQTAPAGAPVKSAETVPQPAEPPTAAAIAPPKAQAQLTPPSGSPQKLPAETAKSTAVPPPATSQPTAATASAAPPVPPATAVTPAPSTPPALSAPIPLAPVPTAGLASPVPATTEKAKAASPQTVATPLATPPFTAPAVTPATPKAAPEPAQEAHLPALTPNLAAGDSSSSIAFEDDAARLPDTAHTWLTQLATQMAADTGLQVQLYAYARGTDDTASKARRLSLSRALAVRSFLIDQGVRSTRIEVRALGDKVPDGLPDRVDVVVQKH